MVCVKSTRFSIYFRLNIVLMLNEWSLNEKLRVKYFSNSREIVDEFNQTENFNGSRRLTHEEK